MRLLDTETLKLHTFLDDTIPHYAVLSHRWDNEEVSYQNLQEGRSQNMPGYAKIKNCCKRPKRVAENTSGLTHVASIKRAAPNSPNQSIRCTNGTVVPKHVMHT